MSVGTVLLVAAGLTVLAAGGEILVRGAAGLARTLGMPSLVVGLTVVSFATSTPELAVSVDSILSGAPGIAVGNVVGSNIANILLVLGAAALVVPLTVRSRLVRVDIPVMVAISVLLLVVALDRTINRLDGALLLVALIGYVTLIVAIARRRPGPLPRRSLEPSCARHPAIHVLFVAGGVAMLVFGARWLVTGATEVASWLGVSDLVIGLTVVAIGTSLPELATSVVAVVRSQRDMAVGNLVGSNVFNIGSVLGITAVVAPDGIPVDRAALWFDLPVMLAVALVLLPIAFTALAVARWEGALFLVFYAAYIAYLVLDATGHDALDAYNTVMLGFVIPITALWLVLLVVHEIGRRRRRREAVTRGR
ncbi:MAG: calcium/sodium antiporter [Actinomycetota bacterium]